MRTTIRLNDRLLRDAKVAAAKKDMSLTRFMEEAVREKLQGIPAESVSSVEFELITFKGDGTCPGIDLDDGSALLDAMEE